MIQFVQGDTSFELNASGSVIIKNETNSDIYHFDVTVDKLAVYKITFSFIDKSFALVLSKAVESGDKLSCLLMFTCENQRYTFRLDYDDYTVSFTPDRQFQLSITGSVVDYGEDCDDEDVFVNKFLLPRDVIDNTSVVCGYNDLLDIMTSLALSKIFTGFMNKRIDCVIFESEILDMIDEAKRKIVLSVYHKDYRHNQYRLFEHATCEDRAKFLEIVRSLA